MEQEKGTANPILLVHQLTNSSVVELEKLLWMEVPLSNIRRRTPNGGVVGETKTLTLEFYNNNSNSLNISDILLYCCSIPCHL